VNFLTENTRSIFDRNINLLGDLDKAIYFFREQQYEKALRIVAESIDMVKLSLEAIIKEQDYFDLVTTQALMEMLSGILEAKKNKDFILLADLLELQLVNFLIGVQELIIDKEEILFDEENYNDNIRLLLVHGIGFPETLSEPVDTEGLMKKGYRIEFTSCGQMTLAAENDGVSFYFHSNHKVREEAFLLAKSWVESNRQRYILYGFGLGYHIRELQELAGEAEIEIYEADLNVMQLACAFGEVKELLKQKRITVIYDPEFKLLKDRANQLSTEEKLVVHYPSYLNTGLDEGKKLLKEMVPMLKALDAL
jgi:hypothetical protein